MTSVFWNLLQYGSIEDTGKSDTLQSCHKNGWIFSSATGRGEDQPVYVLPSPLHRAYFEWKLLPSSTTLPFLTPFDVSIAAIKGFQPSRLSGSPRRVGDAGAYRPPEAVYQDEFYRSLLHLTRGCVRVSSEYSSAKGARLGRISIFVPSKKWGIELLGDGSEIEEHGPRFLFDSAYGAWLTASDLTDHIILDFRRSRPRKTREGKTSFARLDTRLISSIYFQIPPSYTTSCF